MPSIVASSIMLYVINQLEPFNPMEYENQLLGVVEISKKDVKDCLQLMKDTSMLGRQKRKSPSEPGSPKGVFNASFNSDGTNDSWVSSSASSSSSPMGLHVNASKKSRIDDRHQISPFNQKSDDETLLFLRRISRYIPPLIFTDPGERAAQREDRPFQGNDVQRARRGSGFQVLRAAGKPDRYGCGFMKCAASSSIPLSHAISEFNDRSEL
ncbi:Cyclin-D3-1 [Nymphaea thermarum]|nr:Cyclin-D3-1 [Nymphaea thermarum]